MDTIRNTIAENFGGPAHNLGTKTFDLTTDVPDLTGKVALVTGGSEGIGYGITHTLLAHNISKIYVLSIDPEVVAGAQAALASDLGQPAADRTVWLQCDLADWGAARAVADQIAAASDRLDILVNNAGRGIMTVQRTSFGVDSHMALNHVGHVVLTSGLLPLLDRTAREHGTTVRIVNQASNAHQGAPSDTRFASLEEINEDKGPNGQYGRSKLAVILYTRWFARNVTAKHPRVLMNCTHPGFVSTRQSTEHIFEAYPLGGYAMAYGLEPFKKDQFQGATPAVYAATVTDGAGQYICPPAIPEAGSELAQSEELADNLMALTRKLVTEQLLNGTGEEFDDVVLH